MTITFKHKGPKVLLTEGKNDCHVILSLCSFHDIPENFGFFDCGSDDLVLKKMSALIAGSEEMDTIGIILDADNPNLNSKWESVKNRLSKEGYSLPDKPDPTGTILFMEDKPKIGIWLMPNNNIDGMLEDFCRELASHDAINFAEQCVLNAQDNNFSTFIGNHQSKAVIHTYLAWQNEPGMPLGQAITAKALDPEQKIAVIFINFLKSLF